MAKFSATFVALSSVLDTVVPAIGIGPITAVDVNREAGPSEVGKLVRVVTIQKHTCPKVPSLSWPGWPGFFQFLAKRS